MLPRTDTFIPAEWNSFFASLDAQARSLGAAHLCAKVVAANGIVARAIEDAIRAIGDGRTDPDLSRNVESLVGLFENRYESLVAGDEGSLSCQDTAVKHAFAQARAASSVMFALQGRFTDMAYEAVHAMGSEERVLDYLRMADT